MEKRTPHYALSVVRAPIRNGQVRATNSAFSDAACLGFDFKGMLVVINSLKPADFYKSMTTHVDHRFWQDAYRPNTPSGDVYLKLTVVNDVLIVSFKQR
jgi:motility quorum-sensing regulator/GCU-specific mRNA interferase toxin